MGNACSELCGELSNIYLDPVQSHAPSYEKTYVSVSPNQSIVALLNKLPPLENSPGRQNSSTLKQPMIEKNLGYVYEGQWNGDTIEGHGKIYFSDERYYEGEFKNGKADGVGRLFYPDGEYFTGTVVNNKAQGKGQFFGKDIQFDGLWENSKPTIGIYKKVKSKTVVQLKYLNEGTITWDNGNIYNGKIKNLLPHGKGTMNFKNGNTYEGDWENGTFQGYGIHKWSDGKVYRGYYSEGEKQGDGELLYSENRSYVGSWKKGQKHGVGKVIENGEVIYEGGFKEGAPSNEHISNLSIISEARKVPVRLLEEEDEYTGSYINRNN